MKHKIIKNLLINHNLIYSGVEMDLSSMLSTNRISELKKEGLIEIVKSEEIKENKQNGNDSK